MLACVDRAFRKVAQQLLWPQLAQKCESDKAWAGLDSSDRSWPPCGLQAWRYINTAELNGAATWADLVFARKAKPAALPDRLFDCLLVSTMRGVTTKGAKQAFVLTDKELQELPCTETQRPKRGEQHRYSLLSLMVAARAKHGTQAAMQVAAAAMQAATAAKSLKIKAGKDAAAARRCQQLETGLLKLGSCMTRRLRGMWLVKAHIKGGCREPGAIKSADEALALTRLAAWAIRHTGLKEIRRSLLASRPRYDDLWAKWEAAYAASGNIHIFPEDMRDLSPLKHRLSSQEERECLNLAVQRWVAVRGRQVQVLQRRSVPSQGVLRDGIVSALNAQVDAKIAAWVPAGSEGGAPAVQQSDEELTDNELEAAAAGDDEEGSDNSSGDDGDDFGDGGGHWEGFDGYHGWW